MNSNRKNNDNASLCFNFSAALPTIYFIGYILITIMMAITCIAVGGTSFLVIWETLVIIVIDILIMIIHWSICDSTKYIVNEKTISIQFSILGIKHRKTYRFDKIMSIASQSILGCNMIKLYIDQGNIGGRSSKCVTFKWVDDYDEIVELLNSLLCQVDNDKNVAVKMCYEYINAIKERNNTEEINNNSQIEKRK